MHCQSETFVVDPRPSYRYRVMGNRYTPKISRTATMSGNRDCHISLVFLHSVGMFKETFEPVIEILLKKPNLQPHSGSSTVIDEAWSIECPNHGKSALMNAKDIKRERGGPCSLSDFADAVYAFLRGSPGGHDLVARRLVIIGHSAGALLIPFLAQMEPKLTIHSVILAEPARAVGPDDHDSRSFMGVLSAKALARQDMWQNISQARKTLETFPMMQGWSIEAHELYLRNALVSHRDQTLPKHVAPHGVTLACSRDHEGFLYKSLGLDKKVYDLMAALYGSDIPTHLLYDANPIPV
ncbi:hypothetical protein SISNIDRAFT_453402 [Sistotremastrum niveocremeum HHB9708]|uniref:AB hydrolase-1 domain-containing protein n=1 Tax=Sistotremastrum niveocremeum HHB9708 TaxID=1314777 RepID=A0A164VUC2_9AGAM|nr:hypothetical protein SISNIDRAFT_453402 [Sistotremastrum niveocremeum HHB9708]